MTPRFMTLVLSAGLCAASGCSPDYERVRFELLSSPPASVITTSDRIEIPEGVAVVVRAKAISSNREDFDDTYEMDLISRNREILVSSPAEGRQDFALIGASRGETCLEVYLEGALEDCIPTLVVGQ